MNSDNKLSLSEMLFIIVIIEILMVLTLWVYQGYQGKQQFTAALTEIKAISSSSQITPPTSSSHCSKITMRTVDEHNTKQPIITCIISGNPKVRGKTLTYTARATDHGNVHPMPRRSSISPTTASPYRKPI